MCDHYRFPPPHHCMTNGQFLRSRPNSYITCPPSSHCVVNYRDQGPRWRAVKQHFASNGYRAANTLKVKKILPACKTSSIGTSSQKFSKIYAKELFVDQNTVHFGKNIKLSTTPDGNFYCTVNGVTKKFKYVSKDDSPLPGPPGPAGQTGPAGPKGEKGEKGDTVQGPLEMKDGVLSTSGLRDLPCNNLSPLFFNNQTGEVCQDGNILGYAELVDLVKQLQSEVKTLKEAQTS